MRDFDYTRYHAELRAAGFSGEEADQAVEALHAACAEVLAAIHDRRCPECGTPLRAETADGQPVYVAACDHWQGRRRPAAMVA